MTDLQLGLLVLGAAAVVGVVAYNRVQERAARRQTEQAFGAQSSDALMSAGEGRREPILGQAGSSRKAPAGALPDERVDYIVLLRIPVGIPGAAVLEAWRLIEQRFAGRVLLAGSDGSGWRPIVPGEFRSLTSVRAAFQLVRRDGVASDAEVLEFRAEVETLAAHIRAEVSAPEMREALEAARALDKICADADVQVAFHVLAPGASQERVAAALETAGQGVQTPYQVAQRTDGLTLVLDVPRTPDIVRAYEAMTRAAKQLAGALEGSLVDDRGNALDDRSLAAIEAQLQPLCRQLSDQGIEPGSPLAQRLFS